MSTINRPGGWASIAYTFRKAREAGGMGAMWKAMRSKNACKTCAVGMGGQAGGMVNETGHFPEFCKKSVQAMAADMQPAIYPSFWKDNPIHRLQQASPLQLEGFGRIASPVRYTKGSDGYEVISWSEALSGIAEQLSKTQPNRSFFYFSGRSSNEAGFLLQLFARLYGTNNVNNCSFYCHQASGVGLQNVIGSGTATVVLSDLDKTDFVLLIGANPASNHPRLMKSLLQIRRRGGKIVVVNPIREAGLESFSIPSDPSSLLFGSKIATDLVQPHIGGDLALLAGMAKHLIETGQIDSAFILQHTVGFEAFREQVEEIDWETLVEGSGVTQAVIEQLATQYANSQHAVFAWAMGVTHHLHGTETVQMIGALSLLRGMVGKPGAGLMPIRGHSNVQGIGSVGVTPMLKKSIFKNLTESYHLSLPTSTGLDTMACMEASGNGQMDVGICLGGNLYGSNPDSVYAAKSLSKLKLLVTLSTTLNTGHAWALADQTIILPVLPRDEETFSTTQESMFNYVRLSDGGEPRIEGPKSEIAVIAEIAARVNTLAQRPELAAVPWSDMNDADGIRSMISKVVPGWQALENIEESKKEFQIEGRTLHTPSFNFPDRKARFQSFSVPKNQTDTPASFRLMTIRSEGQFNTVVYEDHDAYRGVEGRDVVLIHPDDMSQLNLVEGQRITVSGPAGRIPNFKLISFERIRPGNVAMYFPEANVLLDRKVDPHSKTPAFKGALVRIQA